MNVLVVEDERVIAEPTIKVLKLSNYTVDWESCGEAGLSAGLTNKYDVILLDIMLPKMNGFEILKGLRAAGINTAIIMLTARDQVEDKITGLDFGADDYLAKPFDFEELLARMRAVLRRHGLLQENNTISFANFELQPFNGLLITETSEQKLTSKELALLELLITRNKTLVTKEIIIEKLWDFDGDATDSNVEYHVSKLRKKLKLVNANVSLNVIRGVGYHLEVCS